MAVYAALYRAWRPRRLAEVVGQEHVTRTLRNALRQGHVAHAYLFCGPRGTGKTSTARILAAALNCERPQDGDACGECQRCRDVAADRCLDVRELDAASHRQVEDIRALRETVGYAPTAGHHKVYILDEVHMLTDASWNTLLKTLEEPPPATTFVLCTTDPRKVLPTVVSRCQRFDFRRLSVDEIAARLEEVCRAEGIPASPAALRAIARRADGGLRDALSILDQATAFVAQGEITPADVARVVGAADEETLARLIAAAEDGEAGTLLLEVERLHADGRDMAQVARDLLGALRDRLAELVGAGGAPRKEHEDLGATPERRQRLAWYLRAVQVLGEAEAQMRRWAQPRLVLEVALLQLASVASGLLAGEAELAAAGEHRPLGTLAAPRAATTAAAGTARPDAGGGPRAEAAPATLPAPARAEEGSVQAGVATDGPSAGRSAAKPRGGTIAGRAEPSWEALLAALARENRPAWAVLQEGRLVGLADGTLRIAFGSRVRAELAERHRPLIGLLWRRLGGAPVRVELVVEEPSPDTTGTPVGPGEPSPSATAPGQEGARVGSGPGEGTVEGAGLPPAGGGPGGQGVEGEAAATGSLPSEEAPPAAQKAPTAQRAVGRPAAGHLAAFQRALALFEGTPLEQPQAPAGAGAGPPGRGPAGGTGRGEPGAPSSA